MSSWVQLVQRRNSLTCISSLQHTLILELGFSMMYLMEPWMFSVHDTSQVTLLSWRTSFHLVPGGGSGCLESLWNELTFDPCAFSNSQLLQRGRNLHSLAAVDDDVLRPDAAFEHAHLRVVSTATEQAWGLNAEIGDTFPVVVHDAEAVLLQDALILLLNFLQMAGRKKNNCLIEDKMHNVTVLLLWKYASKCFVI